jgi:hypothetical protein
MTSSPILMYAQSTGNGQVVLGHVGEEVVDFTSLPLPQILAENSDGKRDG